MAETPITVCPPHRSVLAKFDTLREFSRLILSCSDTSMLYLQCVPLITTLQRRHVHQDHHFRSAPVRRARGGFLRLSSFRMAVKTNFFVLFADLVQSGDEG